MTQIRHKKHKCYRVSHDTSATQKWDTRGTQLRHLCRSCVARHKPTQNHAEPTALTKLNSLYCRLKKYLLNYIFKIDL